GIQSHRRVAIQVCRSRHANGVRVAAVAYGPRVGCGIRNSPVDDFLDGIVASRQSPRRRRASRNRGAAPRLIRNIVLLAGSRVELPKFLTRSRIVSCDVTALLWRRTAGTSGDDLV